MTISMIPLYRNTIASLSSLCIAAAGLCNENWPQWRGPSGTGSYEASDLPTHWSSSENIAWKVALPSWASSTPIIWEDRIYIISPSSVQAAEDRTSNQNSDTGGASGRSRRKSANQPTNPEGGKRLLLICYSIADGSPIWESEIEGANEMFRKHNASMSSPVTDGERIWVATGKGTVTAFDMDGNRAWSFDLAKKYGKVGTRHGWGSSPMTHDGKLFVQVLHGRHTNESSYVMAFDGATGEILWRTTRSTNEPEGSESRDAYTTPLLLEIDNKEYVVVVGAESVTGYDPASGKELWRWAGLNPKQDSINRHVASSLIHDGSLFAFTRVGPIMKLDTRKLVSNAADTLVWQFDESGVPDVPSPVTDGKRIFMADDRGSVSCIDAATGKRIWGPERTELGQVSSSLVLADNKLYLCSEDGETVVIAAKDSFEVLAKNTLDDSYTLSSPAISGNRLFLRTSEYLYCIGDS